MQIFPPNQQLAEGNKLSSVRYNSTPFMLHYADGGSYAEQTLVHNVSDLENIALRQRVHKRYV